MKAYLMHVDVDVDLVRPLPPHATDLIDDLELRTVLEQMAAGDQLVMDMSKRALLLGLDDPEAIRYRQDVLGDCLDHDETVRAIYALATEALRAERDIWGFWVSSPDSVLNWATQVMELYVGALRRLRALSAQHAAAFHSFGFTRLFEMLRDELDDEYFATIDSHLRELKFRRGVLISARLGQGNTAKDYVLRRANPRRFLDRVSVHGRSSYSFEVPARDENGMHALGELRGRGINLVANALAQSADHIKSFFALLQSELAFYVGCLNLHDRLSAKGEPTCLPTPEVAGNASLVASGLYDVALSLHLEERVVGNDLDADGKRLLIITGANQGGKSTFLRALGQAQLMMQCGMYVGAESWRGDVGAGVFTHYKREEDASMEHGKLDEELGRMSEIAAQIRPNSLLLCNESFAATTEREGSEIGRQVIRAMADAGVRVIMVTHLYDLAHGLYRLGDADTKFLRAERRADAVRTYKLYEGEPLPTSFGQDTYRLIFGPEDLPAPYRAGAADDAAGTIG
jgi:MutS domain V